MKKIELLSPAGDMECLKMAVLCGADAVYISGKEYGARAYATNFTLEEIDEAVRFCHLYGVRLYVTVNTLINDEFLDDCISYIEKLYKMGVDALIMQDIGLMMLVHERIPSFEIHASTQVHNSNNDSLKYLKSIGCTRSVLAREMSVSDIKEIDTDIELEVFIHGALCVCYSGCCLMSSRLFGRSGNKGACAGPCRFCYDLYNNDDKIPLPFDYLLSMKELCVGNNISELIRLGINSLKIEGRMKSKYYVGYVTKFYRKLIDKYYLGEDLSVSDDEYMNLMKLYNREFTGGFFSDSCDVVNPKTCNHQGYVMGKVLSCDKRIKIKLLDDVTQGDGIRFSNGEGMICNYIYNDKGLLINSASKGDIIFLDNKVNLKSNCFVNKTLDVSLEKEIESFCDRKIPVSFEVIAHEGEKLVISIICDDIKITKSLGVVSLAIKNSTSCDDIRLKLSKLGSSPFCLDDINFSMDDGIFIPIKNVNILRRELVSELISRRESVNDSFRICDIKYNFNCCKLTNEISFLVRNESQLKMLLNYDVFIYVESFELYDKYKSYDRVYYRGSRINSNASFGKMVIGNNSGFIGNCFCISDIYMNAFNSVCVNAFLKSVYKVGLSPELSVYDINDLINGYKKRYGSLPNVEVLVYGKLELMIMKYCPVKCFVSKSSICNACFNNKFYLDDRNNHRFRLLGDENHFMRIFDYKCVDLLDDISILKGFGVSNFRVDLLDEKDSDIEYILRRLDVI